MLFMLAIICTTIISFMMLVISFIALREIFHFFIQVVIYGVLGFDAIVIGSREWALFVVG